MGLIEGFGKGIFRMRKYCREWGISDPEFRENSGFFKTIFYKKLYAVHVVSLGDYFSPMLLSIDRERIKANRP